MTVAAVRRYLTLLRTTFIDTLHPPPDAGLYWAATGDALADAEANVDVYEPTSAGGSAQEHLSDGRWPAPSNPHSAGAGHPNTPEYRHLLARIENLESRMAVLISNHQHR